MIRRIGLLAFTTLALGLAIELGGHALAPETLGIVRPAEAIVGRPLNQSAPSIQIRQLIALV